MSDGRGGRGLPIVAPDGVEATGRADGGAALPPLRDEDLHALLTDFYAGVEREPLLAPYFAPLDMAAHMPRIVDFWSTLLFHTGRYSGNAFRPHLEMPGLTPAHFTSWLRVLGETVDARHAGEAAERMKEFGHRVAHSMQLRLRLEPEHDARGGG